MKRGSLVLSLGWHPSCDKLSPLYTIPVAASRARKGGHGLLYILKPSER